MAYKGKNLTLHLFYLFAYNRITSIKPCWTLMMGRYDVGTMNDYFSTFSKLTTRERHSVLLESPYAEIFHIWS